MKIVLLYGTESGNSELLCDDLVDELGDDHDCKIVNLADQDPATLEPDTFYIVITSTFGNGDLPGQAVLFEEAMQNQKPDLSKIRYAIFGLGDQMFAETFNHGSKRISEMLTAAGATQVGERGLHDASSPDMPEDLALPWLAEIMELAKRERA